MTDAEVTQWIEKLIASGQLFKFYRSKVYWVPIRDRALREQNNECQRCKAKGIYKPATVVHHKERVRQHPELARTMSNLEALCAECHYEEHHKRDHNRISPERW